LSNLSEEVEHAPAAQGSLLTPMGPFPSRSLNAATDFFARMTIGGLPGDQFEVRDGRVDGTRVGDRFTEPDVDHHLSRWTAPASR